MCILSLWSLAKVVTMRLFQATYVQGDLSQLTLPRQQIEEATMVYVCSVVSKAPRPGVDLPAIPASADRGEGHSYVEYA